MSHQRTSSGRPGAPAAEHAAPAVHVIDPHGVYGVEDAIRVFRLKKSTVRREIREGRLRVSKRAGRYYLLGRWLLEWIEAGEVRPRLKVTTAQTSA
jgi:hypothetical protein